MVRRRALRNQYNIAPTTGIVANYDDAVTTSLDVTVNTAFMLQSNQGNGLKFTVDNQTTASGSVGFFLSIGNLDYETKSGEPTLYYIGNTNVSIFQLTGSMQQVFSMIKGN